MGNVGRSCYLFIPFALTIISLILLVCHCHSAETMSLQG